MKTFPTITHVETYCLKDPTVDFVRFEGSYQNILVVVRADNGLYGIGESDSPPKVVEALIQTPSYNYLSQGLAAVLIGETLDDPRRLWQKMFEATSWHGRVGATIHAISALDIALWDLFARTQDKPLYRCLSEVYHQSLPTYATIYPMPEDEATFIPLIDEVLAQGFQRIKICVEPWWTDKALTEANLTALRAHVGDNVDLMLDVAMEFRRFEQLEPFLPLLERLNFQWIEAPFALDNLSDHQRLRQATAIPVGVGDLGLTTCHEFAPYLTADALDIAQPDVTLFGGISEAVKLRKQLQAKGKRLIPHAYNTDITLTANAHLLMTQAACEPLEYSTSPSLLRRELISNPPRPDANGMISLGEEKGLGLSLNWDIIRLCHQKN